MQWTNSKSRRVILAVNLALIIKLLGLFWSMYSTLRKTPEEKWKEKVVELSESFRKFKTDGDTTRLGEF